MEDFFKKIDSKRVEYNNSLNDQIIENIYHNIDNIVRDVVVYKETKWNKIEEVLDNFLTSRIGGLITIVFLLTIVLWITIIGANYISDILASILSFVENILRLVLKFLKIPDIFISFLIDGVYKSLSAVVSVMLPPMAIFFPLFTLLEDLGLLPRIAYNLDKLFKLVGSTGNQALTMAMGFGCNAAGVISTRIIKSPKERLIAIITNNLMPCNGRWPLLILLSTLFIAPIFYKTNPLLGSFITAITLVFAVIIGFIFTIILSFGLSKTILKDVLSFYILELPPFRKPNILNILKLSIIDRTIFVLLRAIYMAAPVGAIVWIINYFNITPYLIKFFDPFGRFFGLDGVIILTYIISLPANELVVPSLIMLYTSQLIFTELDNVKSIYDIFIANGWNIKTAVLVILFSILHNPCSTTILTIYKETNSIKWTLIATFLPLSIAFLVLFFVNKLFLFF
ncbi:MAG: nucleoside recognition domain-containing protein [bacterium]